MSPLRVVGIILIVAGALALAYGGFSYTQETHQAKVGPLEFSLKEKREVPIPAWAGLAGVAVGVVLLVMGKPR